MAKRQIRAIPKINRNGDKRKVILKARAFQKNQVQDARQKLIQQKRRSLKDARDVLAKIAKTQDARNKLNKLRQVRKAGGIINGNIKVIGNSIVQKTDRDGNISLTTNKTNKTNSNSNTGLNATIQKELGLVRSFPKKTGIRRNLTSAQTPALRQSVLSEVDTTAYNQLVTRAYDNSLYKWRKQSGARTAASQMINSLESCSRPRSEIYRGWQNLNRPVRVTQSYIDLDAVEDDEEMPLVPSKQTINLKGSSRISNIHSRLDNPGESETHGIFGQPKTKVVVPAGHRIVVSNLQPSVTQDDVKELFEDIGQLLAARLVRPGVAEVIYKNLKDAQKAVDTYHNRQLDGQPMKCLLVNKRPINNPTAPPLSKIESQGLVDTVELTSIDKTSKLVPDISTIHKVLFQRK